MSKHFVENNNFQQNSLQNLDNYKSDYSCSSCEIFSKYIGILSEYFVNCSENINIQNESYYKYVIIKGVETIMHVFKTLLLYTKNLSLTYYHCQKSFYYYIEFISQIGDNNNFLQLNSRDASIFVYKKTIYELNQDYRKSFLSTFQENFIMNNVDTFIHIYNCFLYYKINKTDFSNNNKLVFQEDENNKIKKCDVRLLSIDKDAIQLSQLILNISLVVNDNINYNEILKVIKIFFDNLILNIDKCVENKNNENIYIYMETFIKKIKKNNISIESLEKRLLNEDNYIKFEMLSPLKYINWIINGSVDI